MPKVSSKFRETVSGSFSAPAITSRKRAELRGRTAAGVQLKKGRSAEQNGGPVALDEPAHRAGLERIGMADQAHPAARCQPEKQVTERVEKRQDVEQPVGGQDVEDLGDGLDVGVDVEMGQDHALGVSLAAAAENHGHVVVDRDRPSCSRESLDQANRGQPGESRARAHDPACESCRERPRPRSPPVPRAARPSPCRRKHGW